MIASRLHRRCPAEVLLEDLVSAGIVGLLQAYERFDVRRKIKFGTLAEHRIQGAMLDYLRQLDPLPRGLRRFQKNREIAIRKLSAIGKSFVEEDVAKAMGIPIKKYRRHLEQAQFENQVSLDSPAREDGPIPEVAALEHATADRSVLCNQVEDAIENLPRSERLVMTSLKAGESAHDIAISLGVTEGRISQLKNRAIERIRIQLAIQCGANA